MQKFLDFLTRQGVPTSRTGRSTVRRRDAVWLNNLRISQNKKPRKGLFANRIGMGHTSVDIIVKVRLTHSMALYQTKPHFVKLKIGYQPSVIPCKVAATATRDPGIKNAPIIDTFSKNAYLTNRIWRGKCLQRKTPRAWLNGYCLRCS
jgi:hypothetical protein